jgi:hypothetical protein
VKETLSQLLNPESTVSVHRPQPIGGGFTHHARARLLQLRRCATPAAAGEWGAAERVARRGRRASRTPQAQRCRQGHAAVWGGSKHPYPWEQVTFFSVKLSLWLVIVWLSWTHDRFQFSVFQYIDDRLYFVIFIVHRCFKWGVIVWLRCCSAIVQPLLIFFLASSLIEK